MGRMAGILAGGAVMVAACLVPGTAQAAPPKITWHQCADDRSVQCGTLGVPIDRSRPQAGSIKIAVARLRAADPKRRLGTLLVNPGGPGGSGVDMVLDRAGLSKQVRQRYDIVGFDPRGVGASNPVSCGKVGKAPRDFPRNQAEFAARKAFGAKLYQACRARTGPLYDHLGQTDVALDMDAIRDALGEQKISFYGISYGTWLGQRYAELFPWRLSRLTLDSTMDHSVAGAGRFSADEARGLEEGYRQFAKWCPTSKYCALRGKNPVKVLDALMVRAERGTLHEIDDPKVRLEVFGLARMVQTTMYDPLAWAELSEELRELSRQKVRKVAKVDTTGDHDGMFSGILCADWAFPVRDYKELAAVRAESRRAAPHVRLNPLADDAFIACLGRPAKPLDPQRPSFVKFAPPSLIVSGTGDPATVRPWAVNVNRQTSRSALLTYQGTGHGVYALSPCARTAVDAYLLTGRQPKAGATCPAVRPDFSQAYARRAPQGPKRF
ncbi:alpha/beta hydrolase [Actinomadura macrotermitis]|nr:alpha/beta hydrolase [Actinomadura macrotermitis]